MSPSSDQLQQSLVNLVKNGEVHETVRLSEHQELKTDTPQGNWLSRIVKPLAPQQIASIHSKQKQDAADLINGSVKNPLRAREITVGQALLQLQPPASDEEFLECLKQDQFEIDTEVGKTLFKRYLEQKIPHGTKGPVDALGEIKHLITEISGSNSTAGALANQWLTEQKIKYLADTPGYKKTFTSVLNQSASSINDPSFVITRENIGSLTGCLPEYFKKVAMVDDLTVPELKVLKTRLDDRGIPPSDPIYQQTLIRLSSEGQPAEELQTTEALIANRQRDLTMLEKEMEETGLSLVNEQMKIKQFEKEKESMSPGDIQESIWVGASEAMIERYELKQRVLNQWKSCIIAELQRLNAQPAPG